MKEWLGELFSAAGAAAWGALGRRALWEELTPAAGEKVRWLCPGAETVFVAAFPYFAGDGPGNLSLYARGEDYHRVLERRLGAVCAALGERFPENRFLWGADNSPLPERELAWRCGVGLRGRNGLVIVPPYGSYVFLGTVLTDRAFDDLPAGAAGGGCMDCGACTAACPTGALGADGTVDASRCLSALTQRKGELTGAERALVSAHGLIWGCDVCQSVCPYNRAAARTSLPEFGQGLLSELTAGDLEGLTNRTFRRRYGDRAFAWRGPGPLRRNLKLKEEGPAGA